MMEGKVVVVTGAGRGIGAAIAVMAAAHGAKVVVNDIGVNLDGAGGDQTPAQDIVNQIKKAGGEAAANYDSVAEFASAAKIIQCAMDHFGRIDGVVNNAGILRDVIFHKMAESDWDSVVNVMLKGAFNCSRHAADHFRKQESGALVHMSRVEGGANVVIEALRSHTPVLASRIDGNVGLLGADYDGCFEPGDATALAALMLRFIAEPAFAAHLAAQCALREPRFRPAVERAAVRALLHDLLA